MLITTLKFVAILCSGLFAFFALLGDNRNKRGNLTIWGRIAVIGVIASTVVAAVIQTIETRRAIDADNKTREMITEIRRAAYPIVPPSSPTFSFDVDVPLGDPVLQTYRLRLQEMTRVLANAGGKTDWPATHLTTVVEYPTGTTRPDGLRFAAPSPALPDALSEPALARWFNRFGFEMEFSRKGASPPARASEHKSNDGGGRGAPEPLTTPRGYDLMMRPLCRINDLRFTYHRDEDALEINAHCELENGALDSTNGRLVSIADLGGAHLTVVFRDAEEGHEFHKIARLSGLSFVISNRHFSVSFGRNPETKNPMGFSRYAWLFPEDVLSAEDVVLK